MKGGEGRLNAGARVPQPGEVDISGGVYLMGNGHLAGKRGGGEEGKQRWPMPEKRRIVEATLVPGATG